MVAPSPSRRKIVTNTRATPSISAASRSSPPATMGAGLPTISCVDRREQSAERQQDRAVPRLARSGRSERGEAPTGLGPASAEPIAELGERLPNLAGRAPDRPSFHQRCRRLAESAGVNLLR